MATLAAEDLWREAVEVEDDPDIQVPHARGHFCQFSWGWRKK
jgi:hypothetical protein